MSEAKKRLLQRRSGRGLLSLTYERYFSSRVALVDRIPALVDRIPALVDRIPALAGDRFLDIVGGIDTRGGELVAVHSIPQAVAAVAGRDAFVLGAECSIPVVPGSTRSRLVARLGSFERPAGNGMLWVEVGNSMFPPAVGIRMFLEVGDSQLFDPSVADSTVVNTVADSTLTS